MHPETNITIEDLLDRMTLDEQISLCHGHTTFALPGIERLGIPELVMSDGPHGVRQEIAADSWQPVADADDDATALPPGVAVAATWDPDMAALHGRVLGAESRHRGKDVILGPGFNIIRTPLCGRNFEYFSEDPHLNARLAVAAIQAIQAQGTAACAKHFACNNQELNRNAVDTLVDERALREIYLPAFEAAVKEGDVLTVMGAYNKLRGQHCCHNDYLLNHILKAEWGFHGLVMSDWGGAHDTFECATCGLDVEMGKRGSQPFEEMYMAAPLKRAVTAGGIDPALIRDKARRVLRVHAALGNLDNRPRPAGARLTAEHRTAARTIAEAAIVLLKNEGGLLPLDRTRIRRMAVIGENATARHAAGGGSSGVKTDHEITPLDGLRQLLGNNVELIHAAGYPAGDESGVPIPAEVLSAADTGAGTNGWILRWYSEEKRKGDELACTASDDLNLNWSLANPQVKGARSLEATTTLTPRTSGRYRLCLTGSDACDLRINNRSLVCIWGTDGSMTSSAQVELQAGQSYDLSLLSDFRARSMTLQVGWMEPGSEIVLNEHIVHDAVEAARHADVALIVGGLNHRYDKEGGDRDTLQLWGEQDELIEAVAAVNPNTVVALVTGSAVAMPWVDRIPAILVPWYGGSQAGAALARVLFGEAEPGGRLPVTFPRTLTDVPAHRLGEYQAQHVVYRDGIHVGYRGFDAAGTEPLFCFGHGCSYTAFAWSEICVEPVEEKNVPGVRVMLTVRNTGLRAGKEVIQIYVADDAASVVRPPKELAAFQAVTLAPGEERRITLNLPPRAFAFYDTVDRSFVIEPGRFTLHAGASSRDLRLRVQWTYTGPRIKVT